MLGFLLSYFSMQGAKLADGSYALLVPVLALALPIVDTCLAIIRRTRRHVHPFQADKAHIHHRLLNTFLNHKLTVHTLWTIVFFCQLLALSFYFLSDYISLILLGTAFIVLMFFLHRVDFLRNIPCENM